MVESTDTASGDGAKRPRDEEEEEIAGENKLQSMEAHTDTGFAHSGEFGPQVYSDWRSVSPGSE